MKGKTCSAHPFSFLFERKREKRDLRMSSTVSLSLSSLSLGTWFVSWWVPIWKRRFSCDPIYKLGVFSLTYEPSIGSKKTLTVKIRKRKWKCWHICKGNQMCSINTSFYFLFSYGRLTFSFIRSINGLTDFLFFFSLNCEPITDWPIEREKGSVRMVLLFLMSAHLATVFFSFFFFEEDRARSKKEKENVCGQCW